MAITGHPTRAPTDPPARGEDRTIALLLGGLGLGRVALAVVTHERFGGEASLGLVMLVLGVLAWPRRR